MSDANDVTETTNGLAAPCPTCADIDRAERDATVAGDHSLATDWRVRRKRHRAAAHSARPQEP